MSIATLLSQHHQVTAVDIIPEKVDMINNRKSPIQDDYIEKYLAEKELNLTATLDAKAAYADADFVVIAAPTNYDSHGAASKNESLIKKSASGGMFAQLAEFFLEKGGVVYLFICIFAGLLFASSSNKCGCHYWAKAQTPYCNECSCCCTEKLRRRIKNVFDASCTVFYPSSVDL